MILVRNDRELLAIANLVYMLIQLGQVDAQVNLINSFGALHDLRYVDRMRPLGVEHSEFWLYVMNRIMNS